MSTKTNLPTLNVEALSTLITWAYQDHEGAKDLYQKLQTMPGWSQGTWFSVDQPYAHNGYDTEEEAFVAAATEGACGSRGCIAGNAVHQSDEWVLDVFFTDFSIPVGDPGRHPHFSYDAGAAIPVKYTGEKQGKLRVYERDLDRQRMAISDVAEEVLGLTAFEGSALFNSDNSVADIYDLATMFAAERGVSLTLDPEVKDRLENMVADEYDHENQWGASWRYVPDRNLHTGEVYGYYRHDPSVGDDEDY